VDESAYRDALREIIRCLDMEPDLKARSAICFTVWDIATKTLNGKVYPWGYEPWRAEDEPAADCG
jgi:antitoxin component HigA of HigAB toxin-antitoxin module